MTKRADEIRERLAAATPGSWGVMRGAYVFGIEAYNRIEGGRVEFIGPVVSGHLSQGIDAKDEDLKFIQCAKSDIAWLLGELDRATKVIEVAQLVYDNWQTGIDPETGSPYLDPLMVDLSVELERWEDGR